MTKKSLIKQLKESLVIPVSKRKIKKLAIRKGGSFFNIQLSIINIQFWQHGILEIIKIQ